MEMGLGAIDGACAVGPGFLELIVIVSWINDAEVKKSLPIRTWSAQRMVSPASPHFAPIETTARAVSVTMLNPSKTFR
jgi:hypothetical protein